jgi:quercetin dioxygenase-like cupin family protein
MLRVIGVIATLLLPAATVWAQATSQPLFSTGEDTLGNPASYPESAPPELTGALVTLPPGDSTGWHRHAVPTLAYLLSGELRVEYATGETRIFRAGDGLIEAQNVVHNGHNIGSEPVSLVVFSAGAEGVPVSEPADPPRPDSFVDIRRIVPDVRIELR